MSVTSAARTWVQRLDRVLAASEQRQQEQIDKNPLGLPTSDSGKNPGAGMSRLGAPNPVGLDPIAGGPKLVSTTNKDGSTSIYSVPGTLITGGFIVPMGEFNPLLMGREAVRTWEKMRRTSSQVDKTLEMCVAPIVGAKWDVLPDPDAKGTGSQKEEIAKAARENLFGGLEYSINGTKHTQTWNEALRNILLMLAMGCSAFEEVYEVDGQQVRIAALADLPPTTFYQWDVEADGRTLRALIQLGYRGQMFERLEVPAERLNVFTYRQEGADFWGRSMLRPAYSHWYAVSALYAIRNVGAERTSIGVPCVTLSSNATPADRDVAVAYVTQIAAHQRTGLVIPNGATFKVHGVEGRMFDSMQDVTHHNEQISYVALDFFSNLGRGGSAGSSGSRALMQGQGKFFMLALQNTADFIAQRMTNVTLTRWTAYNYGPDAPVPVLRAANVQARSFEEVMGILTQAAMNGLVKSDKSVRDEIRTQTGMPQETDEDVIAIRGETVSEGAPGPAGDISGRSAAAIQDLRAAHDSMPDGAPGKAHVETALAKLQGAGQPAAGSAPPQDGTGEKAQLSEKQIPRRRSAPRNDGGAAGSGRATVSPFWREGHDPALKMVHPHETHVDFPAHQAKLDLAEQKVKQVLLRARRKLLRDISARIAAQMLGGKSTVGLPIVAPKDLAPAIESELGNIYAYSRQEMRAESERLGRKQVLMADNPQPRREEDPSPLLAEIAAERFTGALANGVQRAASNLRAGSVTIADLPRNADGSYDLTGLSKNELADLIWEEASGAGQQAGIPAISPNLEDNISAAAVRGAFRSGRSQEAQDIIDALEKAGVKAEIIRVAILDKNVCGPCETADGKPWPLDVPVSTICEGGDLCRCEPIEVRG